MWFKYFYISLFLKTSPKFGRCRIRLLVIWNQSNHHSFNLRLVTTRTPQLVFNHGHSLDHQSFPKRSIMRPTRSINCVKAIQPVPGNNTLAANLMARAWNSSSELQTATTIGAARTVAQKWARNLLL